MPSLSLVITDFALPGETDSRLSRLPALERLLGRGQLEREPVESWRHWVLAEAGLAVRGPLPIAGTIVGRSGHWAMATPTHLLAGLEHVHLDPAGLPLLSAEEQLALGRTFNEVFGADGLRLSFVQGEGLLELPRDVNATSHDPRDLIGCDAGRGMPEGPDGPWLRRLMTEIQMWLHTHPMNAERSARGAAPVNALWIWGHGQPSRLVEPPRLPRIHSDDAFLRCTWQQAGAANEPAATAFGEISSSGGDCLATLELARLASMPDEALRRAEEGWFGPLEAALGAGRLTRARLFLGGCVATHRRSDRFRVWRGRRAWHEALR